MFDTIYLLFRNVVMRALKFVYKFGNSVFCCLCKNKSMRFYPYKNGSKSIPNFVKTLECVGSDVDNFGCPHCESTDRERHLFLYLEQLDIWSKFNNATILHFAPEPQLSRIINSKKPTQWIRCDLFPNDKSIIKMDLLAIPYSDKTFDIVIVNHVLEHVSDDIKALNEIYRVLKPGGFAILQTPYSTKLENTFSDNGIDSNSTRLQAYGQEDHVRLYGKDIFQRIESIGFISRVTWHNEVINHLSPIYYGVNSKEPLFLYEKTTNL